MRVTFLALIFVLGSSPFFAEEEAPKLIVPEALSDDEFIRQELGVNEFTAPSIRKIFENLSYLPAIPQDKLIRTRPDKLPMDRGDLALELGFLMADGFILVQGNKLSEIRPLAQEISRYAKALGAGERVNRHSASLLKSAEKGDVDQLKKELALTQVDVEAELIALRDPDLSHFIGLGGWIRAISTATAALEKNFSEEKAKILFQPDVPEYFNDAIAGLDPLMLRRKDVAKMRALLSDMEKAMKLDDAAKPTKEKVVALDKITQELQKVALKRFNK